MSTRDGNAEIYVMASDGSAQTRLTVNTTADGRPSWSPHSNQIAFMSARDGNQEIYLMNADGTNPVRLTTNTIIDDFPSIK
jgi:TolB protein